jgi:hypothetical protein
MQIGEILSISQVLNSNGYEWLRCHPHLYCYHKNPAPASAPNEYIFIAAPALTLAEAGLSHIPGAGVFKQYKEALRLDDPEQNTITAWRLPAFFFPAAGKSHLSCCPADINKWSIKDGFCYVRRPSIGQEFVLQDDHEPDSASWLAGLFR